MQPHVRILLEATTVALITGEDFETVYLQMRKENEMECEEKAREDMIVFAKQCRVGMDEILQSMKDRQSCVQKGGCACGRNLALAITHCEDSIMRLGMVLKDLNTENPYPNSYKPENTVVDPTADGLKL